MSYEPSPVNCGYAGQTLYVNIGTGEITVADNTNLDYETITSYALMVEVTDTSGALSDTATVTVDVVEVTEGVGVGVGVGVGMGGGEGAGGTITIAMITSPPDRLLTEKSERIVPMRSTVKTCPPLRSCTTAKRQPSQQRVGRSQSPSYLGRTYLR